MNVNGRHNIDELLARMATVRGRLDEDARAAKRSVREMTDWRIIVRKNPLLSVGVAVLAGFLLVPRRRQTEQTVTTEDLERLAKEHRVIVAKEASTSPSIVSSVTALAGAALTRAAASFIADKVSEFSTTNSRTR